MSAQGMDAQSPERKQKRAGHVALQAPPVPSSASVIRVHIGRIEVRAAAPSPPLEPRKKTPKSRPELSLGDYLKKRKGGR
jgi:hypothetical protein